MPRSRVCTNIRSGSARRKALFRASLSRRRARFTSNATISAACAVTRIVTAKMSASRDMHTHPNGEWRDDKPAPKRLAAPDLPSVPARSRGERLGRRIDVPLPLVEQRSQSPRDIGSFPDQIIPLAEVCAHVEQERAALVEDQLPIA